MNAYLGTAATGCRTNGVWLTDSYDELCTLQNGDDDVEIQAGNNESHRPDVFQQPGFTTGQYAQPDLKTHEMTNCHHGSFAVRAYFCSD